MVVLMPENPQSNEASELPPFPSNQDIQVFTKPGVQHVTTEVASLSQENGAVPRPSEETTPAVIKHAHWKALSDARAIKRLSENGKFVRINRPRLDERIETFVDQYLGNIITNGGPSPSVQEYRALIRGFRDAYMAVLHEGIQDEGKVNFLDSPIEARLRDLAIQDRNAFPAPWRRPFHQRDLAVIRVLLELDISLDRAKDELENIHNHADIYEKYYANPREEVIWPSPDTF
jgi:hypothetical protein